MAKMGDLARGVFGAAAISVGCFLGALTLVGGPILVAYFDASIWWLLIPATFLAFSNDRAATAYNMMRREGAGGKLRVLIFAAVLPVALVFGLQWLIYKGAAYLLQ